MRTQTHTMDLEQASSSFVMQRARRMERYLCVSRAKAPKERKSQAPVCRRRRFGRYVGGRTGGGGPWRRFVSKQCAGGGLRQQTSELCELGPRYQSLKREAGQEWQQLRREGDAGTVSHRAGARSFGPPCRKARRVEAGACVLSAVEDVCGVGASALSDLGAAAAVAHRQLVAREVSERMADDVRERQLALREQASRNARLALVSNSLAPQVSSVLGNVDLGQCGGRYMPSLSGHGPCFATFAAPVAEMARRGLRRPCKAGLQGAMTRHWESKHRVVRHALEPPLQTKPPEGDRGLGGGSQLHLCCML